VPFSEGELKAILAQAEWMMVWSTRKGRQVRAKRPTWRRDLAIIVLLTDTGLRSTELCKLQVSDYQQENGRLLVRFGKGNKQRTVYLGATAQRVLWRYMMGRDRIRPADPLFVTRANKRLTRDYMTHMLRRIGDNAGVPHVHPHRFRHTFAIQFLRNGGNVFELQRILGHSELDTVKIYLSIAQIDIERAQKEHSPADNWRL
jgi:integrase/recombinase XerD